MLPATSNPSATHLFPGPSPIYQLYPLPFPILTPWWTTSNPDSPPLWVSCFLLLWLILPCQTLVLDYYHHLLPLLLLTCCSSSSSHTTRMPSATISFFTPVSHKAGGGLFLAKANPSKCPSDPHAILSSPIDCSLYHFHSLIYLIFWGRARQLV